MKMQAALRPVDDTRCCRLLAAWHDGDKQAVDVLLDEAQADPAGVPGLLFALTTFATALGEQTMADYRGQLATWLLGNALDDDTNGEGR